MIIARSYPPNSIWIIAICFVSGLILISCNGNTQEATLPSLETVADKVDTGLMTGQPCAPPCWQGLSPGDPKDKAMKTLRSLSFIDQSSLRDHAPQIEFAGGIIALDEEGTVKSITYDLRYQLIVQQLIAVKGDPDGFRWDRQMDADQAILIYLVWITQGISVEIASPASFRNAETTPVVLPDSQVIFATYFEPAENKDDYIAKVGDFYPWQGYEPLPH